MQISGMIRTSCPPDRLMALLNDPAVLSSLVPADSEIRQTGDNAFAFTVQKALGPLKLKMPGTLTLAPLGDGDDRHLVAHASHLIGGKVDLALDIRLSQLQGMTVVKYDGTMTASGLANRLLGEYEQRAQIGMRAVFLRLKHRAEGGPRSPAKPQGKAKAKAAKKA